MEQNENTLSFDQLPKAVGELLHKVDYVISRLDAPKDAEEASGKEPEEQIMTARHTWTLWNYSHQKAKGCN